MTDLATGLRLTGLLLRNELRIAARTREVIGFMLLFAVLCVLVFAFGFLREGARPDEFVPGVLWVTLLFSGTVGLQRLFAAEEEGGTLSLVTASAVGAWPIFFAKAGLQLVFVGVVTTLVLPLTLVFFDAALTGLALILPALALGLLGVSLVGTLCASLLIGVRMREVMLPLILYPTTAPLLIAGVKVTALGLAGADAQTAGSWLGLMVVFDLVFVLVSPWLHSRAFHR